MRFDPHQEIANEVHEAPTEAQLIKTNRFTVEQMFESIGDENAARVLQPNTGAAARRLQTKQKPEPEPEPEPDTAPQKQLTEAQRRRKKKKRERQKQKKKELEREHQQQQELQSHDDSRIGESASMQPAIPELEEAPEL
jgi:hypothetical protein